MAKKPGAAGSITIAQLPHMKLARHQIYLCGTAPLIVHAFPEKARKEILDKQMQRAKGGRDPRDPYAEVEACKYLLRDGRHGFPAVAFKSAAVTACTSLADVTKVAARQAFRVLGEPMEDPGMLEGSYIRTALVPLIASVPIVREDVVRLSGIGRTPEMRYRPEYTTWGVVLDVELNAQVISFEQLGSMFQMAGHGVGIGDFRPETDGDCGTFNIVTAADFEAWREHHGL